MIEVLGGIVLAIFGFMFSWTLYMMIQDLREIVREDKLYEKSIKCIELHVKHCGVVPSVMEIKDFVNVPQYDGMFKVIRQARKDYIKGGHYDN